MKSTCTQQNFQVKINASMYVGVYMDTHMQTHMLGCTCSKLELSALITIPNCTVILCFCLKSYKWGKQFEKEIELLVPMYSSSLPILILFGYSLILSVFSVENSQHAQLSHLSHLAAKEPLHLTGKMTVSVLTQPRPEHSLQYRGNLGRIQPNYSTKAPRMGKVRCFQSSLLLRHC